MLGAGTRSHGMAIAKISIARTQCWSIDVGRHRVVLDLTQTSIVEKIRLVGD